MNKGDLAGKRMVVTAGGTQEPIDPVRHIGNRSSGRMGYALAEAARDRGAEVKLITAPASLPEPAGVEVVHVRTAAQMKKAVDEAVTTADALIMAAAVADYQPKEVARTKIKKDSPSLTLELIRTPDILAEVKGKFLKVGFAAESLFTRAAMLPRVELTRPERAIGTSTIAAMQSGLVFGYVGLIEGIIARIQQELGEKARVVATGGYAELIAKETSVIDVVNTDLTLIGLRLIYLMNQA